MTKTQDTAAEPGVSIREFARRDGCGESLVRRAIEKGRLTLMEGKKLDPALAGSGWRRTNRRRSSGVPGATETAFAPIGVPDHLKAVLYDPTLVERLSKGSVPLAEAEEIKANGLALKHLIAARRASGELIDIHVAENVIFEGMRVFRDAFLGWPAKVGPLMAHDLGVPVDRLVHALDEQVYQQLLDLGEPEPDFGG